MANGTGSLVAVHLRHVAIHQHNVVGHLADRLESLESIGHSVRRVAEVPELQQCDFPVHLIILRHQNPEQLGLASSFLGGRWVFAGDQPGDALEQPGLLDRLDEASVDPSCLPVVGLQHLPHGGQQD